MSTSKDQFFQDKIRTLVNKDKLKVEDLIYREKFVISPLDCMQNGSPLAVETIECIKDNAFSFYEHLLDLVEKEKMSKNYSEWCEIERDYIALIGEKHITEYFKNKRI